MTRIFNTACGTLALLLLAGLTTGLLCPAVHAKTVSKKAPARGAQVARKSRTTASPAARRAPARPISNHLVPRSSKKPVRPAAKPAPAAMPISTICVEAESGLVVFEENADLQRPPASMVKLMELLLVDDGLNTGRFTLETPVTVSARAKGMGGTQVFLQEGDTWPLERMIRAVTIASANDAAQAVGESLFGGEEAYLQTMNARAAQLGMSQTIYRSAHGLPPGPGKESDMTTARDMAQLARDCCRRPRILGWTSLRETVFRPGEAPKQSTNKLLLRMPECDGLKTGYTRAAGFCITATALRNDIRLITVIMGAASNKARFDLAQAALEKGFSSVQRVHAVAQGMQASNPVAVLNGTESNVSLSAKEDVWVVVRNEDAANLQTVVECPERLTAPLSRGESCGEIRVQLNGTVLASTPLVPARDIETAAVSATRQSRRTLPEQ